MLFHINVVADYRMTSRDDDNKQLIINNDNKVHQLDVMIAVYDYLRANLFSATVVSSSCFV